MTWEGAQVSQLRQEALAECHSALARIGFVRRSGALLQDRGGGASGWIGLNLATYGLPRSLQINPVVGVRFARLDEVIPAHRDDIPKKPKPVISKQLGYLMPENSFRGWEFLQSGDHGQVAASLVEAVREYGDPYIEKYADWGNFTRDIELPGMLMEHEKGKVLPIVLAFDGNLERANSIVASELERVASFDDMYAQSYRDFANKFFAKFG
jgi:hypothetical protein